MRRALFACSAVAIVAVVFVLAARVDDGAPGGVGDRGPGIGGGEGAAGTPMITEVATANGGLLADTDGDHPAWIEVHNPAGSAISFAGYRLGGDDASTGERDGWALPDVEVPAGGHLVVFASGKDRVGDELHTDFTLERGGGEVVLTDGARIVDRVEFPETARNVSVIRHPAEPSLWCVTNRPTPGAANDDDCATPVFADPPSFSVAGGFHAEGFDLELEAAPAAGGILYTLDGSYPDPVTNPDRTHVYDGPIAVPADGGDTDDGPGGDTDQAPDDGPGHGDASDDASDDGPGDGPGHLTAVETIPDQPDAPQEPVQQATVVRARTLNGLDTAETYFVGEELRREQLPVVSLVLDAEFLVDHDTGLYVPGAVYEAWRTGPDFDPDRERWRIPGNYTERGREWERPPADDLHRAPLLSVCDAAAGCADAQHLGVRIHGGTTRTFRQKSLRLYARNDYGERTVRHPVFGSAVADDALAAALAATPQDHRRLLLRNSGDDWPRTMFLDGYLQSLVAHLPLETQAYRPAVLFINGEYWGIHNFRERYDRHHLEAVHGVDPDEVIRLEPDLSIDDGEPGDEASFIDVLELLRDADPASPEVLAEVEAAIDLDDLIEYLVVQLFTANTDWPGSNLALWRVRDTSVSEGGREDLGEDDASAGDRGHDPSAGERGGAGPAGGERDVTDGRWRLLTYDLDHAGNNELDVTFDNLQRLRSLAPAADTDPTRDELTFGSGMPWLTARLLENDEFRQRFLATFAEQLNTSFRPSRSVPIVDGLEALLVDEIPWHAERWRQHRDVDHWRGHVDDLRTFMERRPAVVRDQLVDTFDLEGVVDVEVRHDPGLGEVTLGALTLHGGVPGVADPSSWDAEVFAGVPVQFSAHPTDGAEFVAWDVQRRSAGDTGWEDVDAADLAADDGASLGIDDDAGTLSVTPTDDLRIQAVFR